MSLDRKLDVMETRRVRSEFWTRLAIVLSVLTVGAMLAMLLYIASLNRAGVHRVVDCTTPGGECYERGRSQTGEAVGSIGAVTIAAAACADRDSVDGFVEIKRCVERYIEAATQ